MYSLMQQGQVPEVKFKYFLIQSYGRVNPLPLHYESIIHLGITFI